MFGGRFSLTRYSLPADDGTTVEVRANLYEFFKNASSFGSNAVLDGRFQEDIQAHSILTASNPLSFQAAEEIGCRASVLGTVPLVFSFMEDVEADTQLAENIFLREQPVESCRNSTRIGLNIWLTITPSAEVAADTQIGKNVWCDVAASEIVQSVMSLYTLEQETMRINVTVPAGGRLYIDCDNFNILLNGQNVLHLHSGEWISLDRDTVRLLVDSGTGGKLAGNLMAIERYL